MSKQTLVSRPTAASLKKQLRESLEITKKDFQGLTDFMAELASDGTSTPIALTADDLNDLLSVTVEIRDAANDIEFEVGKIRDKLNRLVP